MDFLSQAARLLKDFKGDSYLFGPGVLSLVGSLATGLGQRAALVRDTFPGSDGFVATIRKSLEDCGIQVIGEVLGARPNAPREDLFRIASEIKELNPDVIISFGGGSTIDAAKAGEVLRTLGGEIDQYFGTGLVTTALLQRNLKLTPHLAIQTVASSGAHLTKYANITDTTTGQKKLIVDDAIIPTRSAFDYSITYGAPASLTMDGALDGVSHCLEVLYGVTGKSNYDAIEAVALAGIGIVIDFLPKVMANPLDQAARNALCMATDLGGYAIMLGGTNGGHLTSFSFVDILSHGRACALMNPYYTVFFAPSIERPMHAVGQLYQNAGLTKADLHDLNGRQLGLALAEAMFELARRIGFPTRLSEVPGFTDQHIERALIAAKNPQLKMKLENMPVPLTADRIDETMGPILWAAKTGELAQIKNGRW